MSIPSLIPASEIKEGDHLVNYGVVSSVQASHPNGEEPSVGLHVHGGPLLIRKAGAMMLVVQ